MKILNEFIIRLPECNDKLCRSPYFQQGSISLLSLVINELAFAKLAKSKDPIENTRTHCLKLMTWSVLTSIGLIAKQEKGLHFAHATLFSLGTVILLSVYLYQRHQKTIISSTDSSTPTTLIASPVIGDRVQPFEVSTGAPSGSGKRRKSISIPGDPSNPIHKTPGKDQSVDEKRQEELEKKVPSLIDTKPPGGVSLPKNSVSTTQRSTKDSSPSRVSTGSEPNKNSQKDELEQKSKESPTQNATPTDQTRRKTEISSLLLRSAMPAIGTPEIFEKISKFEDSDYSLLATVFQEVLGQKSKKEESDEGLNQRINAKFKKLVCGFFKVADWGMQKKLWMALRPLSQSPSSTNAEATTPLSPSTETMSIETLIGKIWIFIPRAEIEQICVPVDRLNMRMGALNEFKSLKEIYLVHHPINKQGIKELMLMNSQKRENELKISFLQNSTSYFSAEVAVKDIPPFLQEMWQLHLSNLPSSDLVSPATLERKESKIEELLAGAIEAQKEVEKRRKNLASIQKPAAKGRSKVKKKQVKGTV